MSELTQELQLARENLQIARDSSSRVMEASQHTRQRKMAGLHTRGASGSIETSQFWQLAGASLKPPGDPGTLDDAKLFRKLSQLQEYKRSEAVLDGVVEGNFWTEDKSQHLRLISAQVSRQGSFVASHHNHAIDRVLAPYRTADQVNEGADVVVEEYDEPSYRGGLVSRSVLLQGSESEYRSPDAVKQSPGDGSASKMGERLEHSIGSQCHSQQFANDRVDYSTSPR